MERPAFTHEGRRPIDTIPANDHKHSHVHCSSTARLPDQRYRYKLQGIHELGGRDHMSLWVPSEATSWLVWTLGRRFRGGHDLFDRLRLNVAYLQALVWHKSDQIGVIVHLSDEEHEV